MRWSDRLSQGDDLRPVQAMTRQADAKLAASAGQKTARRNPSPAHLGGICTECGLQASPVRIRNGQCIDRVACAERAKEWE